MCKSLPTKEGGSATSVLITDNCLTPLGDAECWAPDISMSIALFENIIGTKSLLGEKA